MSQEVFNRIKTVYQTSIKQNKQILIFVLIS